MMAADEVDLIIGNALRTARKLAGLSMADIGPYARCSVPHLSFVERGERPATPYVINGYEQALGHKISVTGPDGSTLTVEDMRRRALLGTVGAAAIAAVIPTPALAATLSYGDTVDWDALIADFDRRLVNNPTAELGDELLSVLTTTATHVTRTGDTDATRAAGQLSLLYGLWLGNNGSLQLAHHWYTEANQYAATSGDRKGQTYIQARVASRGPYDGYTAAATRTRIDAALTMAGDRPSLAALEARAAAVHLAALTGDITGGRAAVNAMWRIAAQLSEERATARAASFHAYLEGRTGTPDDAERAYGEVEDILRTRPAWLREARIYHAHALVRAGQVRDGIDQALDASSDLPYTRHFALAVADVVAVIPPTYRGDNALALADHAPSGPKPWTLL